METTYKTVYKFYDNAGSLLATTDDLNNPWPGVSAKVVKIVETYNTFLVDSCSTVLQDSGEPKVHFVVRRHRGEGWESIGSFDNADAAKKWCNIDAVATLDWTFSNGSFYSEPYGSRQYNQSEYAIDKVKHHE